MGAYEFDDDDWPCGERIRLLAAEYREIEEIPGIKLWWEAGGAADHSYDECRRRGFNAHYNICCAPKKTNAAECCLTHPHDGEHAALLGILYGHTELEPYIFWRTGVRGAREIRQPGSCLVEPTPGRPASDNCQLFKDHPGRCRFPKPAARRGPLTKAP